MQKLRVERLMLLEGVGLPYIRGPNEHSPSEVLYTYTVSSILRCIACVFPPAANAITS